ncbi:HEXXH motif domain-containing protein [Catenuloplanes japonicus]|uniref:HEXXH motif domain-containing protein n=1 Tax=Catenuloplanes japonicus TaxID=33876 RepID=UPI000A10BA19|nr:HEXXH motif domain-containing protein [Catenuloplanes japonicus]
MSSNRSHAGDRPLTRSTDGLLPAHEMSEDVLARLLAGRGDAAAVRTLAGTERSWRLLSLHMLMVDLAHLDLGPLPPVGDARQLLVAAETASEVQAADVIGYPQAGIWVAHMLRRLRRPAASDGPWWPDAGYLHLLAAAAAIRARVDFTLEVPLRSGAVVLPTLGRAAFPGAADGVARVARTGRTATVSAGDRTVEVGRAGWEPVARLTAQAGGLTIGCYLDDIDPYRDLRGYRPPAPLPTADVARWQELLSGAWEILVAQDRARAETIAAALISINPLPAAGRYRPVSASCGEAFGAMLASAPSDPIELAVTLVHETAHMQLGALMHLLPFVTPSGEDAAGPLRYAPWRDDPRPLPGLLQGVYAFTGITDFWRHQQTPAGRFEYALWHTGLNRTLRTLHDDPQLSADGRHLIDSLTATAAAWPAATGTTARLAADAATDHHTQWRARHIPPPPGWVTETARAWKAGQPCPPIDPDPADTYETDRTARWLDARAVLIRTMLDDRPAFHALTTDPARTAHAVPGALPADLALLAGDYAQARDGYLTHLTTQPDDPAAWAGLALALRALGDPQAALLLQRPELIRAAATALTPDDLTALTTWMSAALPTAIPRATPGDRLPAARAGDGERRATA